MSKLHPYFQLEITARAIFATVLFMLVFSSISRGDESEVLDSPWMQKVPCKDNPEKRSIIALGGPNVICLEFDAKELMPGAPPQTLGVTIYGPKGNALPKIDSLAVAGRQHGVTISPQSGPRDGGNDVTSYRTYRYSLILDDNLEAEPYQMKLTVRLNPCGLDDQCFAEEHWNGKHLIHDFAVLLTHARNLLFFVESEDGYDVGKRR
jgi:hypothetical protein